MTTEKTTRHYSLYNDKGTIIPFFVREDEDLIGMVYRLWSLYSESCDKIEEVSVPDGHTLDRGVLEFDEHCITGKVLAGIKWENNLHNAHYCQDWDFLWVDKYMPEFEITCLPDIRREKDKEFKKKTDELIQELFDNGTEWEEDEVQ